MSYKITSAYIDQYIRGLRYRFPGYDTSIVDKVLRAEAAEKRRRKRRSRKIERRVQLAFLALFLIVKIDTWLEGMVVG